MTTKNTERGPEWR